MVEKGHTRHLIRALGRAIWPAFCLAICLLLAAPDAGAAIVNSLSGFAEDDPGWSGALGGSFGAKGGNTEQTALAADARLQWRMGRDSWRLIGSAKRTSSGGVETARVVLGHLRHNHSLSEKWSTLAFLQAQENPFQHLESRLLAGAGLRWDLLESEEFRLALGAAHMVEREKINDQEARNIQRLSVFVTTGFQLREGVILEGLAFFQPSWSEPEDWRLLLNADLDVKVAGNISLFTGLEMEGDSRPPTGVEKIDWENRTGFRLKF